jgi:cysteine desulfurase
VRAYLDHASTSPLRPAARHAMIEWLERTDVADPGRLHAEGMAARVAVEEARERVAARFGARPREVVFTSGATESIAMACWGAARSRGPHSVVAAVEHSAVREWAQRGPHDVIAVDRTGRLDAAQVAALVREDTGVVHCQWGNHEVATLQPVAEMVAAVDGRALVHVDAAATAGLVPIDFVASGVDLLSLSGHKLGGPAGVGVLLVRRGLRVEPLLVGGDQERARRAGMENVAAIVGLAAACDAVDPDTEAAAARAHTERVITWARSAEGVEVLGDPEHRLPHIVCLGLADVEPQPVLLGLDQAGVAVHSGSSCSTEAIEPSPVLAAMGVDAERSLRISVGWSTTSADIDRLLEALPRVLTDLRSLRG